MMRDREGRLGEFARSAALGTIPRDEDTVQTWCGSTSRGSVYNVYVWGPRRMLGIRGMPHCRRFG